MKFKEAEIERQQVIMQTLYQSVVAIRLVVYLHITAWPQECARRKNQVRAT